MLVLVARVMGTRFMCFAWIHRQLDSIKAEDAFSLRRKEMALTLER